MTKIDKLNEARTDLLNAYLDLLDENLTKAKEIYLADYEAYTHDSKVIRIKLGRRMGASTWIKDYLMANPKSDVICTDDFKKRMYKGLNAVSVDSLIMVAPTAFNDSVVFIDLPPAKVDKVLEKLGGFLYYCKCVVIV